MTRFAIKSSVAMVIATVAFSDLCSAQQRATAAPAAPPTAAMPTGPLGLWIDHTGRGAVEIINCGNDLCGRIVWLQDPNDKNGRPLRDTLNEDASKRGKPICGLQVIGGVQKRVFLVHDIHRKKPELVNSRFAMSYLRGPLTREEIRSLGPEVSGTPEEKQGAAPAQSATTAAMPVPAAGAAPANAPAAAMAPSMPPPLPAPPWAAVLRSRSAATDESPPATRWWACRK